MSNVTYLVKNRLWIYLFSIGKLTKLIEDVDENETS